MADAKDDELLPELCAAASQVLRDAERHLARPSANAPYFESVRTDAEIVAWCEKDLGLTLKSVPKVLAIFLIAVHAFRDKKMLRLAVLGPRGGGKTKLTAAIELVAYRWFGYSWQNIGGSLEQAARCYGYIATAHMTSPSLQGFTASTHSRETKSRRGGTIGINAASHTSVRGAHPVGPAGGGGITLDEAALIPDDIIDASKGQLTSANPSAVIQLSTMGEDQSGRFWELISEPAKFGYQVEKFDVFDVAKRCPYDCASTCPVKEHFADDYYEGPAGAKQLIHKAYCAGRAHDVNGWIPIEEVAQQWREMGRSSFERELMGKATAMTGCVYDPSLLNGAVLPPKWLSKKPEEHRRRFLALDKYASVDWGFGGATAICYSIRLQDVLVVFRWDYFHRERFQVIREHLLRLCFEEHIETILVDSANPSDNEELAEMSSEHATNNKLEWNPRVLPVVFSRFKDYGIGEVNRRLEKGLLKFCTAFGGAPVEFHDKAMKYLKMYRRDESGKPIKVDDHVPDALMMNCLGLSISFRSKTAFVGGK